MLSVMLSVITGAVIVPFIVITFTDFTGLHTAPHGSARSIKIRRSQERQMQEIVKPYLKPEGISIDDLPADARAQIEQLRGDYIEQVKSSLADATGLDRTLGIYTYI